MLRPPSEPSPEEVAAAIAALEQFLRDSAPGSNAAPEPAVSPWKRTALAEGVARAPDSAPRWVSEVRAADCRWPVWRAAD